MVRRDVVSSPDDSTYHVKASVRDDSISDPAHLDLVEGYSEPDLCFSKSHVRDPAYALLDSGATHVSIARTYVTKGSKVVRSDSESRCREGECQLLAQ